MLHRTGSTHQTNGLDHQTVEYGPTSTSCKVAHKDIHGPLPLSTARIFEPFFFFSWQNIFELWNALKGGYLFVGRLHAGKSRTERTRLTRPIYSRMWNAQPDIACVKGIPSIQPSLIYAIVPQHQHECHNVMGNLQFIQYLVLWRQLLPHI